MLCNIYCIEKNRILLVKLFEQFYDSLVYRIVVTHSPLKIIHHSTSLVWLTSIPFSLLKHDKLYKDSKLNILEDEITLYSDLKR